MIHKYIRYKVLQEFFDFPRKNFQIRELVRKIKLGQPSVTNHLKELLKEEFIIKEKKGIYPSFRANRDNENFKLLKKFNIMQRILEIGLLDYIYDSCLSNVIILFGSASKGEDIEESDIDLFIQSKEKKLNLDKYEKKLNRKINLFFEENILKLSKELKNNIINGIILKGYLSLF
ncbi:MAG: nucleotidyltransferase domain-containing protein [archaeon]